MATIGLNISGGEFGGSSGVHNYQYHYPSYADLKFYADKGVDLIRVPFKWERVQDTLGGPLDLAGDLALIKQLLIDAAALGMDVILDCHNYGRYKGVALGAVDGPTAAQFADFWQKMALELKDYPALVGYDLMNEPHDMPTSTIWKESAQAATNAIREVDMENTIIIEGNAWSGAYSWLKYNSDLIINDPANNIVYQAHQYFDDDNSGTYGETYEGEGAYPTMGADKLKPFVDWLNQHGLKGMIGETGVPSNDPRWIEVMKNALDYMIANNLDVTAWAGGTWWGETYSMYVGKPGAEDSALGNLLEQYYNKFDGFDTQGPAAAHSSPIITIGNATASEGGTLTFTVTRSGDLSGSSTVNFSTAKGTAISGSDFTSKTGTLTFAAGETTKTITVVTLSDDVAELAETLKVNLTAGSNARIWDALGVGTVNDAAPTTPVPSVTAPSVVISDVTVNEQAGTMTFTVTRSGDLTGSSSVNFATADGTAIAGSDYTAKSGTVSFAAGETTKTITVAVTNDTLVESAETLKVNLSAGTNVTVADGQGIGTINSDDIAAPTSTTINGTNGRDALVGTAGVDYIYGHGGNDTLNGSGGADILTGGNGKDVFIFSSAANANGDWVTDFRGGLDKLDFSKIDANPNLAGDQSFHWLDSGAFTKQAGQLREFDLNGKHYVAGDLNGDGVADFTVEVAGTTNLTATDFLF